MIISIFISIIYLFFILYYKRIMKGLIIFFIFTRIILVVFNIHLKNNIYYENYYLHDNNLNIKKY